MDDILSEIGYDPTMVSVCVNAYVGVPLEKTQVVSVLIINNDFV